MNRTVVRAWSVIILLCAGLLGWSLYSAQEDPDNEQAFRFGLDLVGGSHLVYEADTSALDPFEVDESMAALREVIELRTNIFGVSEPLVQVEKASALSESDKTDRLIVELPGVTDLAEAVETIGATPQLEFMLIAEPEGTSTEPVYEETGLTGRYLKRAHLEFSGSQGQSAFANEPLVLVDFNDEGKALFASITRENVGRQLAIFLDNDLKSSPVIREPIIGGTAVISGSFTAEEGRELVRNLNIGALPVPIELASTQTVGATLGAEILDKGLRAGMIGLGLVLVFMLGWYRLLGFVAAIALTVYVILMLGIFMYVPVTITAAGIAGFLLSIGMAVDANVLIFERIKEELRRGAPYEEAVQEGFRRAWAPIRDGNFTSLISAVILFWFGTSIVQGFALVFGLGILASMFTAVTITRTFLLALSGVGDAFPVLLRSGMNKE
jgi:protein-export membrane protein SecD